MRHLIGSVAALVTTMWLAGCASGPHAPSRTAADHSLETLKAELAHSAVETDAVYTLRDDLAHTIGTTTLTSAFIEAPTKPAAKAKVLQTWGVSEPEEEETVASDDEHASATRE
jgi:hypothetical protein